MWKLWYKFKLRGWTRKTNQAKARWIAAQEYEPAVPPIPNLDDYTERGTPKYSEYVEAKTKQQVLYDFCEIRKAERVYKACAQQQRYYTLLLNPPTQLPAARVIEND